jgi:hypothetical protein
MSRSWIVFAAAFALFTAPEARADGEVCEPPVSICGPFQSGDAVGWKACPAGTSCKCVPSIPGARDCPVSVCVPEPAPECDTACDCAPGLGCFDGTCRAGFAPVYCCDAGTCPEGEMCQDRNGAYDKCSGPDRVCSELLRKVTYKIDHLVKRTSACRSDDDCVYVNTSTGCAGTCGAFVHERYENRVEKIVDHIDRRICDGYVKRGCPVVTPGWRGCLAVRGACVENRCQAVPWRPIPIPHPHPVPLPRPEVSGGAVLQLAPAR